MAIRVYACGFNFSGNLGNDSVVTVSSPIIMSTTGWYQMPVGINTMAAIGIDRNVYTWGSGTSGALGNDTTDINVSSPIQITSDGAWSMVGGGNFFVALKNDGTIWSWGDGSQGGIGNSLKVNYSSMIQIGTANNWIFISASPTGCAFGIKSNGSLWSWGSNISGQQGLNTTVSVSSPVQVGTASNWSQIACGQNSFAIKTDGTLWATGDGSSGNNGLNRVTAVSSWTQVGTGTDWAYCCSQSNNMALKNNGTLWVWGLNNSGNLGDGTVINRSSPVQIVGSWTMATAQGDGYKGVKTDGTLWVWGSNSQGQIGNNTTINRSSPVQVLIGSGPFTNLGFNNQQLWVQADGPSPTPSPTVTPTPTPTPTLIYNGNAIFGWGQSLYGLLANNTAVFGTSSPTLMFRTPNWITMPSVFNAAGALNTSRNLMVWGFNFKGELAINNTINRSSVVQSVGTGPWAQVSMHDTGAGIKEDGTLWTWGVNENGQLGNNTASVNHRSSPAQVGSATDWSSVSSGEYNGQGLAVYSAVLAIKNNGTMYGWGRNALGLIGDNSIISRSSPVLSTGTDWQRVETGYVSAVALKNDGTLWSVGANSNGQLGQGDKINRSSWTQIGTGTYIDIAAGRLSAAAIRSDGTLWAFGDNAYGQLARGNALDASSPVQIGTASDWVKVSASSLTVGAINSSGQLWMWGSNTFGQIGRNATAIGNYSSPVQTVMTAYRYIDVQVGFQFVMAAVELPTLTPSPTPSPTPDPTPTAIPGQLYVWGDNQNGQLGLNTSIIDKSTPVQLASLSWIKINYDGMFAGITTTGTVWGCGYNFYGNLSTNNTINYSSLIQIGTAGVWKNIVIGSLALHLIKNDGTLWGVGGNSTAGLLGNNAVINRSSLIQIGNATDWTRFCDSTNAGFRFAWRGNSLYAWGGNLNGNLGLGIAVNVSSPVLVDSSGTWNTICAAGSTTSIAVKTDGTLWTTGSNANGQLGIGSVVSKSTWTQVGSGTDWATASASYDACFAIKNNGSLYAWGANGDGLIGQDSTSILNYSSPVRVGASNDWESVVAGSSCCRAQKKDGTLWVWGSNDNGVLGTNQAVAVKYSSPTQTVYQSTWASAYGGGLTNSFGFIVGPGPTTAPTVTPSATPSSTISPTATPSPTPSPSPSRSPSPTPTLTVAPTATPNPTASPVTTATSTPSPSPSRSPSPTPSPSPSVPSSPTPSPSPSRSPSPTPSISPSNTPSPTPSSSLSPTPSPTLSPTATPSVTNSPTPSVTLSSTPSPTPSNSPSPTPSPSPTTSPSPTPSNSPSPTPSPSPSHSPSPTPSPSPSNSPSPTPSPSPSPSPSATATPLPSQSPFPTFTPQPTQSPQPTFTPQPTLSPVPTVTPFPTLTQDPTPTGSPTPFPTDTPQPTLTPVPTVTPFPTLTPLPTFTPFPTLTPQATPTYPLTNNYVLVPYQNNMNVTNIVPSQEGYAFNNGGGSGINLLLQFMQNDPEPQQVFVELTNNSSTNMVITIGNIVYIVEPGEYFNTVALMPFGQKVTVQSQEPGNFTSSMVYGQIFLLPTPTPTPVERLQLQKCTIAVEGDAGSVDTALINCHSVQRTGYITITHNINQVKVMEIPDGGIIDKTIQQIPQVIPLVCSGFPQG